MLPLPIDAPPTHAALFSRILRTLRRRRGLSAMEVAHRMGLPKRTYELFESGVGRLSLQRLQDFARATDTDAYAIFVSLAFGDPGFALRCADLKLMTIAVMAIQDLNSNLEDDIQMLDPRSVMQAMETACGELVDIARLRSAAKLTPRGE